MYGNVSFPVSEMMCWKERKLAMEGIEFLKMKELEASEKQMSGAQQGASLPPGVLGRARIR